MNKTVTINLSGLVFQVDEEAYDKLKSYLDKLKARFANTEGSEEIIEDIESRIAEMLSQKLGGRKEVVMMADVDQIIEVMGQPEEIDDEAEETTQQEETTDKKVWVGGVKTGKRLYRNVDDKIVAGVGSGISAYLGVDDPLWVRLAFVAFIFFSGGTALFVYFILWFVLPEATTASEKLEMRGEPINVDNIEKTIKEDFDGLRSRLTDVEKKSNTRFREFFHRFFRLIAHIVILFARIIGSIIGFGFLIAGIALGIFLLVVVLGPNEIAGVINLDYVPYIFPSNMVMYIAFTSITLLIVVPAVSFLYSGLKLLFFREAKSRGTGVALAGFFTLAVIGMFTTVALTAVHFDKEAFTQDRVEIQQPYTDTLILAMDPSPFDVLEASSFFGYGEMLIRDNQIHILDNTVLAIEPASGDEYELERKLSACGSTYSKAEQLALNVVYDLKQDGDKLTFQDYYSYNANERIRWQQLNLNLRIPVGKSIYIDESMLPLLALHMNVNNVPPSEMVNHHWTMTEAGLECKECVYNELPEGYVRKYDNEVVYTSDPFSTVKVDGYFYPHVQLVQAEEFSIIVQGDDVFTHNLVVDEEGGVITFTTRGSLMDRIKSRGNGNIYIEMPNLDELIVKGFSKISVKGFEEEDVKLLAVGSCNGTVDVNVERLNVKLTGTSKLKLQGSATSLNAELNGASKLQAYGMETDTTIVETFGTSTMELNARKKITAELNGASTINYIPYEEDPPTVLSDVFGTSSINPQEQPN